MSKLEAVGTKVIFERLPDEEVTASGIVLPNRGVRRTCKGRIISVGEEVYPETVGPLDKGGVVIILSKGIDKIDYTDSAEIYWCDFESIIGVIHED